MTLFFRSLFWLVFVLVLLIELIYAQSQPHWFLAVLGFTILNGIAFVGWRLLKPRVISRSSS
jgi:hypothetical protein